MLVTAIKARLQESREKNHHHASVIALHGDLGAGKTTFVQAFAAAHGVTEVVTSPTFVVMKTYQLDGSDADQLVHIDAYRIETDAEMEVLHVAEYLNNPNNLLFIEWADNIKGLLPPHTINVRFTITGEERIITIDD